MWLSENKFTILGSNPIGDAIFILNLRSKRKNSETNSIKSNVAEHCGRNKNPAPVKDEKTSAGNPERHRMKQICYWPR
jgi:hypothetical protein